MLFLPRELRNFSRRGFSVFRSETAFQHFISIFAAAYGFSLRKPYDRQDRRAEGLKNQSNGAKMAHTPQNNLFTTPIFMLFSS